MTSQPITVSNSTHRLTALVANHTGLWKKLGAFENKIVASTLSNTSIASPIYISGLARSGSTLLLEILAAHPDTASHIYRDFPFLFTPCWWNAAVKKSKASQPQERAHGDGILINEQSPEALEEALWTAFFDNLHTTDCPNLLTEKDENPKFERFYRDHIKKVQHIRKAPRYLAKANYNITRLAYLHKLFPDARFIIPIREPVSHVASLMRQHTRFCAAAEENPRIVTQMKASGHYEFGPHRIPIHTGQNEQMAAILESWQASNEAKGYALQWAMIYGTAHALLQSHPTLATCTHIMRYEDLCNTPYKMLHGVFTHCGLTAKKELLDAQADKVTLTLRDSKLNPEQITTIHNICSETAQLYGYE